MAAQIFNFGGKKWISGMVALRFNLLINMHQEENASSMIAKDFHKILAPQWLIDCLKYELAHFTTMVPNKKDSKLLFMGYEINAGYENKLIMFDLFYPLYRYPKKKTELSISDIFTL